jgi:hypothetical protein
MGRPRGPAAKKMPDQVAEVIESERALVMVGLNPQTREADRR